MDKLFITKLALRNLFSHKLRTMLTLIGIIIGISAVVFLIALSSGIQRLVTQQITGGDAFQLIDVGVGNSQVVRLNDELVSKIDGIDGVGSIETIINLGGKAKSGENSMDIAFFVVSSESYLDWSGKKINYGQNLKKDDKDPLKVVVNSTYAAFVTKENPKTIIGQRGIFDIVLPKELSKTGEPQTFEGQSFEIVGVIKEDASPSIYTTTSGFSLAEPTAFSQVKARIDNRTEVDRVRKQVEAYGLKTEYVGDTVAQVQQFFGIFKIVLGSFGVIALVVALLGMFNTLTISLLERIKEVALMKIFGMGKKDVMNLFIVEALVLGLIGGVLGIAWGMVLGKIANTILNYFAIRAGGDAVAVFYYTPAFLFLVLATALLVGFVTGFYPANRAKRVNVLDVLRYE
ncbi:MAG: FtsX-like permease family protein [Patescibacteria group bacterium]